MKTIVYYDPESNSYSEDAPHDDAQTYLVEPVILLPGTGQVLRGVHSTDKCEGQACCIHNPSDHHMQDWPMQYRRRSGPYDVGLPIVERICEHGVGHPDPDDAAYVRRSFNDDVANAHVVHGCCGCCKEDS